MCGIGGIAGTKLSHVELKATIKQVCDSLRHRGPDDQDFFIGSGVALGSTRLAIRDLSSGKQPMTKNGVHIVFNGEIYNTDTLRSKIQLKDWRSHSDTEVILEGYIQYGSNIFKELSGMFAFAIWDEPRGTFFLVRDRWGEKPLYYVNTSNGIAFASEIIGLKPWKHLKWHNGSVEINRYYYPQLDFKAQEANKLKELIQSCIKKCAISDKPIGAFLSGGIDSSTVVTCLQQFIPTFPVYSIDWENKNYSEKKYSAALCKKLGLKQHLILCDQRFMIEQFDRIVSCYGEPFGDESMIPTFCLAKHAKEDVDVVLTGDGADEFFHGYERYFFNRPEACYSDIFSAMDKTTRSIVITKDIQNYLADDILTKIDRATMSIGLEARAPFLMPEITSYALHTPIEQLIEKETRGKWILRKAVKDILPSAILNRKKQGFGVPLGSWFSCELREWMMDKLLYGTLPKLGYFSMTGIETISQHPQRYSRAIYNLLVLESWWRQNIY